MWRELDLVVMEAAVNWSSVCAKCANFGASGVGVCIFPFYFLCMHSFPALTPASACAVCLFVLLSAFVCPSSVVSVCSSVSV